MFGVKQIWGSKFSGVKNVRGKKVWESTIFGGHQFFRGQPFRGSKSFGVRPKKTHEITIQVRFFWNNITWRAVQFDQTKSKIHTRNQPKINLNWLCHHSKLTLLQLSTVCTPGSAKHEHVHNRKYAYIFL